MLALALLPLLALTPSAHAHGQLRNFIAASGTYAAADAYGAALPNSPIRKISEYGPAAPFTGANITCGPGGNVPTSTLAVVKAGETVTFDWGSWGSSHSGPLMTYIAKCTGGCASFKGDSGNVWVKIDQDSYNPDRTAMPWGENILHNGAKYSVTIPSSLANGEYLLRHEILGLHVASTLNGAQFYPQCVQVSVTGGGSTQLPTGVAFPGAYVPQDTGILVELWRIQQTPSPGYLAPGGPVILPGGTGDWGTATYGGTPALPA